MEKGKLEITDKYEDIHSFVEANLDRPGSEMRAKSAIPEEAVMIRWHLI